MDLPELLAHITELWPHRFERGLITHLHANDLETQDGSRVHLRVLIQARNSRSPIVNANDLEDLTS